MNACRSLDYIDRHHKLHCLAPLLREPWSILLDSGGNDTQYNRFDILVTHPCVTLTFRDNRLQIHSVEDLPSLSSDQPLNCLRELMQHFNTEADKLDDVPFQGGWLGYISYDFGRHLERLPDTTADDIELPWLQMGLYRWALITDHLNQTTTLYNFGLNASAWLERQRWCIEQLQNLRQTETESSFQLLSPWQSNTSPAAYATAFERIQRYIHQGDCYQVNYAQRFSSQFQGDCYLAYQKLSAANRAPFSAYMQFEDHQILSLSPERFIESHQGKVLTQPIKGTRPRSADSTEDQRLAQELIHSEKDRAENLMIVDLLRNDLSRTAADDSVIVSELFGHYQFASVHHLISTIESRLEAPFDCFDLLATTLPGGSITGAPKIRAMQIIEELESVKRNLYCGIIAYIDFQGNMDSNICIRTLIAKNQHLYCWAGGGLVADSTLQTEYEETFHKLAKILPVLVPETHEATW